MVVPAVTPDPVTVCPATNPPEGSPAVTVIVVVVMLAVTAVVIPAP